MDNASATNRYLRFLQENGSPVLISIESILHAGFPIDEDGVDMELESNDLLDCDGNPT